MTSIEQRGIEHSGSEGRASLRWVLTRDHERLERLFEELCAAFDADARADAAVLWTEFDAALRVHMDLEERFILPAFSATEPHEAAALLDEHERIRAQLDELGVGVDLHLLRAEVVSEFTAALRRHAERENALMYRWADHALPSWQRDAVSERVRRGLRTFFQTSAQSVPPDPARKAPA
jgi:hemerythrin-like domain-containing protein